MINWKEFCEENRPGGTVSDRSLEGFRPLLDQLTQQAKGVMNPQAKAELNQLINNFYGQMKSTLMKYKNQGIGYSPNYQPNVYGSMPNQSVGTSVTT